MKKSLSIKARVTGLRVNALLLRRKIAEGGLTNQWELAFVMPGLGTMPMEDDLRVEILDENQPKEEQKWVETTVGELKTDLLAGKYLKKKISTS